MEDPVISSPGALSSRFAAVYTGALADVLDELGLRRQTLPPEIVPLAAGMHVAGYAFAVEGRTNHSIGREASMRRILEMLGSVPAGHVAVYQPGDDTCAHFGELSATSLRVHECAGVVIDGGCRDVAAIRETGLPVFARYRTPRDAVGRWEVLRWGHSIAVGDVRVRTGDFIVGDADGVVVIPRERIPTVLELAESLVGTENEIREAVRQGMKPLDAYDRFGKF